MGGSSSANTEAQALVDKMIQENHVMVFSKAYCPYCKMAKQALNEAHAEYKVLEIENRNDCGAIQDVLRQMTGASSVPRVFIGGKCIGGGTETQTLHRQGKLAALCKPQ